MIMMDKRPTEGGSCILIIFEPPRCQSTLACGVHHGDILAVTNPADVADVLDVADVADVADVVDVRTVGRRQRSRNYY